MARRSSLAYALLAVRPVAPRPDQWPVRGTLCIFSHFVSVAVFHFLPQAHSSEVANSGSREQFQNSPAALLLSFSALSENAVVHEVVAISLALHVCAVMPAMSLFSCIVTNINGYKSCFGVFIV